MSLTQYTTPDTIPVSAGIGLRAQHYNDILTLKPDIGWFEVHSENYFGDGGAPHYYLHKIREQYPISLHGVGLSIGSTDTLNIHHLQQLKNLIKQYEPGLISEHLSWSHVGGRYLNDLIPLPYTEESLIFMADRIQQVQEFLGRQILIENVSSYLEYKDSTIAEYEYINALANRSGCGILLDVNNIYVNAMNHDFDPSTYLKSININHVHEIHLAGHSVNAVNGLQLRIDSHDGQVCDAVWNLYREAAYIFPQVPVLFEWDTNVPALSVLLKEAEKANLILGETCEGTANFTNRI